jgi:hypothetical protein
MTVKKLVSGYSFDLRKLEKTEKHQENEVNDEDLN